MVLQVLLVFGVDFHEGACYREAQSLALAGEAAAVEVGLDVILLGNVEQLKGLLYNVLEYARGEIFCYVSFVYGYFAGALSQVNISIALGFCACMLCSVPSKM